MLETEAISPAPSSGLLDFIQTHTGQNISACYQCGKCSAGCPTAYTMDITPRQVMRALQLGLKDELLDSSAIWLCVSCQTCSLRCPREIDIARIIESLRYLSQSEGKTPAQKDIALFYSVFLQQVLRLGRIYEVGLGAMYNLRSRHLFANMGRIPSLLRKGKLKPVPRIKGVSDIRRISSRAKKLESELK